MADALLAAIAAAIAEGDHEAACVAHEAIGRLLFASPKPTSPSAPLAEAASVIDFDAVHARCH